MPVAAPLEEVPDDLTCIVHRRILTAGPDGLQGFNGDTELG